VRRGTGTRPKEQIFASVITWTGTAGDDCPMGHAPAVHAALGSSVCASSWLRAGRLAARLAARPCGPVANPEPWTGPVAGRMIVWVRESAAVEREAATADALGQPDPQPLQLGDPVVDPRPPGGRQLCPVRAVRRTVGRELGKLMPDFVEREPDSLSEDDEGDSAQNRPSVPPMLCSRSLGCDEPARLIEAERRSRNAASARNLPNR
jgi:hypothetical protein